MFPPKKAIYYKCKCNADVIHVMGESTLWREMHLECERNQCYGHEVFLGSNINVYSPNHGTLSYTLKEVSTTITQIGSI